MRRLTLSFVLLLAACGGEQEPSTADLLISEATSADTYAAKSAPAPPAMAPVSAQVGGARADAPAPARMVIRNAEMQLAVAEPESAAVAVTKLAEGRGGYVTEQRQWRDADRMHVSLVVRVPAPRLTETLGAIRRLGVRVESEHRSGQDVTQEYTDQASRLRNLEAAEAELRELLRTARERAQRASDIMEVYGQLTSVRGEIEQIKGRMQYLAGVTALATITLQLVPDAMTQPLTAEAWRPFAVVRQAGSALLATLEVVANAVIWLLVYGLPLALLVGLPLAALYRLARRQHAAGLRLGRKQQP